MPWPMPWPIPGFRGRWRSASRPSSPTCRVVGAYEDAWDLLRAEAAPGPFMPCKVMLVTGLSRSADIEQMPELGAHGPWQLHIVLIEDDTVARS